MTIESTATTLAIGRTCGFRLYTLKLSQPRTTKAQYAPQWRHRTIFGTIVVHHKK